MTTKVTAALSPPPAPPALGFLVFHTLEGRHMFVVISVLFPIALIELCYYSYLVWPFLVKRVGEESRQ